MKTSRLFVAWLLVLTVGTPVFAGDLQTSIVKAAQQPGQQQRRAIDKTYAWTAGVLIVTGMTMAVSKFFDGAEQDTARRGAAKGPTLTRTNIGLGLAVTGAVLLALGHERAAARAPEVTFSSERMTVSKRVAW